MRLPCFADSQGSYALEGGPPEAQIFHSSMLVFAAEERGRGGHCVVFIADPDSAFGSEKDQA